jgi:hypothetical protein
MDSRSVTDPTSWLDLEPCSAQRAEDFLDPWSHGSAATFHEHYMAGVDLDSAGAGE